MALSNSLDLKATVSILSQEPLSEIMIVSESITERPRPSHEKSNLRWD